MSVFEAPAKVNLSLLVGSAGADGYHPIESLVQTVEFCDSLSVEESDEDSFIVIGADLDEEDNLVVGALRSVRDRVFVPPVAMQLDKRIPLGAGLGGGSSDAAAMLLAATGLARQPTSLAEDLAPGLGSDVPLFLIGGSIQVSGYGEVIESQRPLEGFAIAIAVPGFELATADVYRKWDRMQGPAGKEAPTRSLPGALTRRDADSQRLDPGRHGSRALAWRLPRRSQRSLGRSSADDRIRIGMLRTLRRCGGGHGRGEGGSG